MSLITLVKNNSYLSVPDPLACLPARAGESGGLYRYHPSWTAFGEPYTSLADLAYLGKPTLRSVNSAKSYKITHRSSGSTFAYLSVKNGRTQTGESHYELQWAQELEVDPNYVDYQLHGMEVNWKRGDHTARYTPDAVALTVDAKVEGHEVKATRSYFQMGTYSKLIDKVDRDLASYGIAFRKVTGADLEANRRRHHNITTAFQERFTHFSLRQEDAVRNLLERNSEQSFARVLEAIDPEARRARPIVSAMLCRRKLAYDLNQQITCETVIRSVDPVASCPPDIRAL